LKGLSSAALAKEEAKIAVVRTSANQRRGRIEAEFAPPWRGKGQFVYIIKSLVDGRYYIGYTGNLAERLNAHNRGSNRSTKKYRPWVLIAEEEYSDRKDACRREKQIKSYKGGEAFKKLIENF